MKRRIRGRHKYSGWSREAPSIPIARCCTVTSKLRAINGFEALHIGITRGILGQRLRNARPPPSSSSKMLHSTLSLSLSFHLLRFYANLLARRPPPSRRQSGNALGRCFRPTYPNIPPPTPFRSSASLAPPPPTLPSPHPARFAHLPTTDVPDQPLLPPRFLSFVLSFFLLRPGIFP